MDALALTEVLLTGAGLDLTVLAVPALIRAPFATLSVQLVGGGPKCRRSLAGPCYFSVTSEAMLRNVTALHVATCRPLTLTTSCDPAVKPH